MQQIDPIVAPGELLKIAIPGPRSNLTGWNPPGQGPEKLCFYQVLQRFLYKEPSTGWWEPTVESPVGRPWFWRCLKV